MSDYIAESITEAFGERCTGFSAGCHCCEAWAQYDDMLELLSRYRDGTPLWSVVDALEEVMARAALSKGREDRMTDEKKMRPWRFPDEWYWGLSEMEAAISVHIEHGDNGCHTLVVSASELSEEMFKAMANIGDSIADYILENPHLYGLRKIEERE